MKTRIQTFTAALSTSVPVFFGYLSIGLAFGFLLVKAGIPWIWAPIMSNLIFAGAAQFLSVGMLSAGIHPAQMALAVLLINARHLVYGFSLLERFAPFRRYKPYLIFALTDETYGLLTTIPAPEGSDPELFDLYLAALNHSYWVAGSTLGALGGSIIPWSAPGIEFSMTALFTVLLIEQIRSLRRPGPFLISAGIFATLTIAGLTEQALLLSIVASSTAMFFLRPGTSNGTSNGTSAGQSKSGATSPENPTEQAPKPAPALTDQGPRHD